MKTILLACAIVGGGMASFLSRCADPLVQEEKALLDLARETEQADWKWDREKGEEAYFGFTNEDKIIEYGERARPFALRLLESYDPRLRCAGLTILRRIPGPESAKAKMWVDHLDDPWGPIRIHCVTELRDAGLVSFEESFIWGAPLLKWKQLKESIQRRQMRPTSGREKED